MFGVDRDLVAAFQGLNMAQLTSPENITHYTVTPDGRQVPVYRMAGGLNSQQPQQVAVSAVNTQMSSSAVPQLQFSGVGSPAVQQVAQPVAGVVGPPGFSGRPAYGAEQQPAPLPPNNNSVNMGVLSQPLQPAQVSSGGGESRQHAELCGVEWPALQKPAGGSSGGVRPVVAQPGKQKLIDIESQPQSRQQPSQGDRSVPDSPYFVPIRERRCYRCQAIGHIARDCELERPGGSRPGKKQREDKNGKMRTQVRAPPRDSPYKFPPGWDAVRGCWLPGQEPGPYTGQFGVTLKPAKKKDVRVNEAAIKQVAAATVANNGQPPAANPVNPVPPIKSQPDNLNTAGGPDTAETSRPADPGIQPACPVAATGQQPLPWDEEFEEDTQVLDQVNVHDEALIDKV